MVLMKLPEVFERLTFLREAGKLRFLQALAFFDAFSSLGRHKSFQKATSQQRFF